MNVFLDISSVFKLYHQEQDSNNVERIFTDQSVTTIFLSELTKIEFSSTVWRKIRMQEISESQAKTLIEFFENDFDKYHFVQIDTAIIRQAGKLLIKYGNQGLRTLDSIQLATAVLLKDSADLFATADKLLHSFFSQEGMPT